MQLNLEYDLKRIFGNETAGFLVNNFQELCRVCSTPKLVYLYKENTKG